MGPVENMTVGYLVPKRRFQAGSAASICPRNGCPGVATRKSLLNPTGLVCTAARERSDNGVAVRTHESAQRGTIRDRLRQNTFQRQTELHV